MFNKLKLKYSILLGYFLLLLMTIVAFAVGYISTLTVVAQETLTDKDNQILIKSNKLYKQISKMHRSTLDFLIAKNDISLKQFEEAVAEYNETSLFLAKMISDPTQRNNLQKLSDYFKKFKQIYRNVIIMAKEDKKKQAMQLFNESKAIDLTSEIENLENKFEKKEQEILQSQKATYSSTVSILKNFTIFGTIFAIVFSVVICLMILFSINKTITETINTIASNSTEIATTFSECEDIANRQVAMVNETTITMNELKSSSMQLAEQFESAMKTAQKILTLTKESNEIFKQSIGSPSSVKDKVKAITEEMVKLEKPSGQILTTSEGVKDLATQINVLGLMQTVEAARIGENGREFAVSASEVRKLAIESKKFAEQIKTVIVEIQESINSTIIRTKEGRSEAEKATEFYYKIENLLNRLAESTNLVSSNSHKVLLNSRQQSVAVNQIISAMNSINSKAKETVLGINKTKIGLKKLKETTQNLKHIV